MSRKSLAMLAPAGLLILLALVGGKSDALGAPWISLEIPANPMDPSTQDAVFLIHGYYHENPARWTATGTAEGLVDGERHSVDLEFTPTARPGVYAVKQQWPSEGHWVLSIGLNTGRDGPSLLVELGPDGGIEMDHYLGMRSTSLTLGSVRVVHGTLDASTINRTLRTLAMKTGD